MNRLNILIVTILFLLTTTGCANRRKMVDGKSKRGTHLKNGRWVSTTLLLRQFNQFEMWQEETFDPKTMELELGRAGELGFNTVRIFLHDMVWEADPGRV